MNPLYRTTETMANALTFHRQRHSVLAGNVANVDTPGFRPLDLERTSLGPPQSQPAQTDAEHLESAGSMATTHFYDDEDATPSLDGNTVSMERELAKIDANRVRYTATSRLISKRMAALRYASTDGVG